MNKNTNESWNYAKYRTICILPEEMIREYGRAAWMEKADELYEKVKEKIMELPIAEAEQKMKQVDVFFRTILEGKECSVESIQSLPKKKIEEAAKSEKESSFYVREHVLGAKEEVKYPEQQKEASKKTETYDSKIRALLTQKKGTYSYNYKEDEETFRKVRKYFKISDHIKIYFFIDYTIFGGCKEGVAVCENGIYFRTISSKYYKIKWSDLTDCDFEYSADKQIKYRKKNEIKWQDMWFFQPQDAKNVFEMLIELQKL